MATIEDLTEIPRLKLKEIVKCLDGLLTFRSNEGEISPLISGYNWYNQPIECDRVVTFSNIHETEAYKQAMLADLVNLGFNRKIVLKRIREKAGAFLWDPRFRLRDDKGRVLAGLKIRDARDGNYIILENFGNSLVGDPRFKDARGYLVGEDFGWEIDLPFSSEGELTQLVNLFLKKSGVFLYDSEGNIIEETEEQRKRRCPWTDAYKVPVLIIGCGAVQYKDRLPGFVVATKIQLIQGSNEISFIVHKNSDVLRNIGLYTQLRELGFNEELCLGNKPFIDYIDEIR